MLKTFKHLARRLLEKTPGGKRLLKEYGFFLLRRRAGQSKSAKEFFTNVYQTGEWGEIESVSGPGSTIVYTENLRLELAALLRRLEVRKVLDAPCGDFNWMRFVELPVGVNYIGGDIVEPLIARNAAVYGNDKRSFRVLDIRCDPLPPSDLWICRDVLFHISNGDIFSTLRNFVDSKIEYVLFTTHPHCRRNRDIPTGAFRLLNLEIEPFRFVEPLLRIDDWVEGMPVRHMCLWRRDQIVDVINRYGQAPFSHNDTVGPS